MAGISGTYGYDGSERDFDIDEWADDGWEDALIEAFLDGATADELADILRDYISDDFYREMLNDFDVSSIDWDPPMD